MGVLNGLIGEVCEKLEVQSQAGFRARVCAGVGTWGWCAPPEHLCLEFLEPADTTHLALLISETPRYYSSLTSQITGEK